MGWYENAEAQIERELEHGLIDDAEYREQMRDLQDELRDCAEEAGQAAYDDVMF